MSHEKKAGRPPNVYGITLNKFEGWFQYASKKSKERVLDPLAVISAYVAEPPRIDGGHHHHLFRVTLTPQSPNSVYYWVRLETPEGDLDFTIPAPMRLTDIDKYILPRWDVEDPWWIPTEALPSVVIPGKIINALVRSSRSYYVLVRDHETSPDIRLKFLRGAHTVPKGLFAGIVTGPETLNLLKHYFFTARNAEGVPVEAPPFPDTDTIITSQQLSRLRAVGAAWAKYHFFDKRKPDPSGEPGVWPFVPHAELLGVPLISRTELDL